MRNARRNLEVRKTILWMLNYSIEGEWEVEEEMFE